MPRTVRLARHHTSISALRLIQFSRVIYPSRGEPAGVHVETEPFGSIVPGIGGPKAETGATSEGAYVEFLLPDDAQPTQVGPRNTAVIPIVGPLVLDGLDPRFVNVRRWWNLWFFWR